MIDTIKEAMYDWWRMFWYHLIYRQVRYGNLRKRINRFTGTHTVYKVHPLARVGVTFTQEQADYINQLFKDEGTLKAQQLIVQKIEKEMDFGDLAEAFMEAAQKIEEGE